jgi:hypothetical protein
MGSKSKQTWPDLMIITGFMMIMSAAPLGFVLAAEDYSDLHWAIIYMLVVTAVTGIVGGVLLTIGRLVSSGSKKFKAQGSQTVQSGEPISPSE